MSFKSRLSRCLASFEGGRSFRARVRHSVAENRPGKAKAAWPLSQLRDLHVEASFLCNLKCRMCCRLVEGHREGIMPAERFHRLTGVFPYMRSVVLTGYGEPLLNPLLAEFVATVRNCGAKPRLTTNATLLNEDRARRLIESGLDNIHISIDAGTRATYEQIRVGASWDAVIGNVRTFCRLRDQCGAVVGTAWHFLVMRDNFRELPQAAQLAADLGCHTLVTSYIARNALDYEHSQLLHTVDGDFLCFRDEFAEVTARTREIAQSRGIEFRPIPYLWSEDGACLSDPLHAVFVDWMGNVTPCCQLPVRSDQGLFPAHSFGNIDEEDFNEIIASPRFERFLRNWAARRIPGVCRNCYQVARLPERETYTQATDD